MNRTFAPNRIRELRSKRNMTQLEVAEAYPGDITKATIAKLETRAMALTGDYVFGLAEALKVAPGELFEPMTSGARTLPLIGSVAAGRWAEAITATLDTVEVPSDLRGERLFALRVVGDSMDRIVPDGGIAVINPDDIELRAGKIYVVANGEGDTTIKRFCAEPPRLEPVSNNPRHTAIAIGREPFVAVGRAIYAAFPL